MSLLLYFLSTVAIDGRTVVTRLGLHISKVRFNLTCRLTLGNRVNRNNFFLDSVCRQRPVALLGIYTMGIVANNEVRK